MCLIAQLFFFLMLWSSRSIYVYTILHTYGLYYLFFYYYYIICFGNYIFNIMG